MSDQLRKEQVADWERELAAHARRIIDIATDRIISMSNQKADDFCKYGLLEQKARSDLTEFVRTLLAAQGGQKWIESSERMPTAGQRIVKEWANGNVWAGLYTGNPKDSSFVRWAPLPGEKE